MNATLYTSFSETRKAVIKYRLMTFENLDEEFHNEKKHLLYAKALRARLCGELASAGIGGRQRC
jgi:hypothetical protein